MTSHFEVEFDWALEENVCLSMLLDIDELVDLIDIIFQEYLLTVVDLLLKVNDVQVLVLDSENPQHVRPGEALEVSNSEHVHHLPVDELPPIQILLHYLRKA